MSVKNEAAFPANSAVSLFSFIVHHISKRKLLLQNAENHGQERFQLYNSEENSIKINIFVYI